jgi:hypothetical protein
MQKAANCLSHEIIEVVRRYLSQIWKQTLKANQTTNSVALVRERTIPTERQPLVGEVSANF